MIGRVCEPRPSATIRRSSVSAWLSSVCTGASSKLFAFQSYVNMRASGRAAGSMSRSDSQLTTPPPPFFLNSHVRGDSVPKPWIAMILSS